MKLIKISLVCVGMIFISTLLIVFFNRKNDYDTYVKNIPLNNQALRLNNYVQKLSFTVEQYEVEITAPFEKVAENDQLELFLDKETLAIAVRVKENGYVWFSYDVDADLSDYSQEMINQIKSGVRIITYNKYTPGKRTVLDKGVDLSFQTIEKGFKATIDFTEIMIKFDLLVHLDGGSLLFEVPRDSLEEYNLELWVPGNVDISLHKILLYPFFGSTERQDNGYIVIPDGTGAIVSLNDEPKYKLAYSQPIYGSDYGYEDNPMNINGEEEDKGLKINTVKPLSRITMPIYGIIHEVGNNGILVVSESGESYATYNYMAKDLTTDFYQSYFDYNYRVTYKQYQSRTDMSMHILGFQAEPNKYDLKQRVVFLTDEDANYVGVAKTYRKLLEEHSGLSQISQHLEKYPTKIDFIGNEIEKGLFSTKKITATRYNDAVELIKTLQKDGYESLDVTFKTFNHQTSSYRFDIYNNLGGKDDLEDMIKTFANDDQVDFNYFVDYTQTYKPSKESASRMSRAILSTQNYSYIYNVLYMNNPRYLSQLIKTDVEDYQTYDIDSLAISGLSRVLFTHNDKGSITYRNDNMEYTINGIDTLKSHNINTNIYNPDAYLYPFVNKYYDNPYSSSEQMFIDATIPLLQLIVSGHMEQYSPYLNFITNEQNNLLRLLEYGINPSYVMTTEDVYNLKYSNSSNIFVSEYDYLKERMKTYDAFIRDGLNAINGTELIDHTFLAVGISRSEYSNGKIIIVNYTNSDYDYNGKIIEAKGYGVL